MSPAPRSQRRQIAVTRQWRVTTTASDESHETRGVLYTEGCGSRGEERRTACGMDEHVMVMRRVGKCRLMALAPVSAHMRIFFDVCGPRARTQLHNLHGDRRLRGSNNTIHHVCGSRPNDYFADAIYRPSDDFISIPVTRQDT